MKIIFNNANFCTKRIVTKTLHFAAKKLSQPAKTELELSFISEEEIKQINNNFRKIDQATDVLSFPSLNLLGGQVISPKDFSNETNHDSGNIMLGDIFICQSIAARQAKEFGHSLKREIAFLALHGFLHLLGYDHIHAQDEEKMTKLQNEILNSLNIIRK